jgi:cell pole-organizing protein PopZ
MSENPSDQEPSIEEILASIRQIISDDDEEEQKEEEKPLESPVRESSNDVLELTEDDLAAQEEDISEPDPEPEEIYIPEEEEKIEIDMRDIEESYDAVEPEPETNLEPAVPVPSDILSSGAQAAALGSLGKLKTRMPIERSRSYDGVTLEDIVRETLHPMLREWMDDHLPSMVERIVQKEIEKLTRRAMDD